MPEKKNREHARSNRFFLKIAGRRLRAYSIVTHVGRPRAANTGTRSAPIPSATGS